MKIGILGGTFDPPHEGHLALARIALETLDLDEIIWIPNFETTLKRNIISSAEDRIEMVRLLIEQEPKMCVSDIETSKQDTNYSVDTLWELHQIYSAQFWLILGSDTVMHVKSWKQPEKLLQLCRIAVGLRPPHTQTFIMAQLPEEITDRLDWLNLSPHQVSSTELRDMLSKNIDTHRFLPSLIKNYINQKQLYKQLWKPLKK